MTLAEQISAIQRFGYTAREAAFVATAALHSGYFLTRQFCPERGKTADTFCHKLLRFEHGTPLTLANRTRLFHLSAKPIYAALGQEENKHRRPRDPAQARLKVMALDFVLAHPEHRFLPTEDDKLTFFCQENKVPESLLPVKVYAGKGGNTRRYFIDKNPIRIDRVTGRVAFCFIEDGVFLASGFNTWLRHYAPLIRGIRTAEVVYVARFEDEFRPAHRMFSAVFPDHAPAITGDLLTYFEMRKDFTLAGLRGRSQAALDAMKRLQKTFAGLRFEQQYDAWISLAAPVPSAAAPTFTTFQLEHDYRILYTAVRTGKS